MAGILIVLIRHLPFLATTGLMAIAPVEAQSPSVIPSRVIRVVEFDDAGNTYRVDLESGAVTRTKQGDVVPKPPAPEPPKPPKPEPPKLDGMALRVNEWFRSKVTTNTVETAADLAQVIDTTLAVSGGLGYKGKQVLDEFDRQLDSAGIRPSLKGFPLGDAIGIAIDGDPSKVVQALRDAKTGLEAIK